jgi:transketolase
MYLRISRMLVPSVHSENYQFRLGKADLLNEGTDITLIANGVMVGRALEAAHLLAARGISARVLNMSTVKPLDREAIVDAARSTRGIVTAEEGLAAGGLGGAVAEVLAEEHPAPMRILGLKDVFAPTGTEEFLLDHFGLNAAGIERAALELLENEG